MPFLFNLGYGVRLTKKQTEDLKSEIERFNRESESYWREVIAEELEGLGTFVPGVRNGSVEENTFLYRAEVIAKVRGKR